MATALGHRVDLLSRRFSTGAGIRALGVAVAICLAIDARVHLHDAGDYGAVRSSVVSQATLFRIEAVLAVAVAVTLLLWPRRRLVWLAALALLTSAFAAVLLYTY